MNVLRSVFAPVTGDLRPATRYAVYVYLAHILCQGKIALSEIAVSRNGAVVADCTGGPAQAVPDPCVASRTLAANGEDVEIAIRR